MVLTISLQTYCRRDAREKRGGKREGGSLPCGARSLLQRKQLKRRYQVCSKLVENRCRVLITVLVTRFPTAEGRYSGRKPPFPRLQDQYGYEWSRELRTFIFWTKQ